MKTAISINMLVALACAAPGCSDDVAGEPLLESTLTGDFRGSAFTPVYGFARPVEEENLFDAVVQLFLGTDPISCADDFMGAPRAGTYVTALISGTDVGVYGSSFVDFTKVSSGGDISGGGSGSGTIEIIGATPEEFDLDISYADTVGDHSYALSGSVSIVRCP